MGLIAAKCTNCGAAIEVDNAKEAGICTHCGTAFITEKVIHNYSVVQNITKNIFGSEKTEAAEYLESGEKLLSMQDWRKAETVFHKVTEIDAGNWKGWYGLVRALTHEFTDMTAESYQSSVNKVLLTAQNEDKETIAAALKEYEQKREAYAHKRDAAFFAAQKKEKKKKIALIVIAVLVFLVAIITPFGINACQNAKLYAKLLEENAKLLEEVQEIVGKGNFISGWLQSEHGEEISDYFISLDIEKAEGVYKTSGNVYVRVKLKESYASKTTDMSSTYRSLLRFDFCKSLADAYAKRYPDSTIDYFYGEFTYVSGSQMYVD